jgi:hypothetical protein
MILAGEAQRIRIAIIPFDQLRATDFESRCAEIMERIFVPPGTTVSEPDQPFPDKMMVMLWNESFDVVQPCRTIPEDEVALRPLD